MRHRFAWLVVLLTSIGAGPLPAATSRAELDLIETAEDRVIVRYTIENTGADDLWVLYWNTPLWGFWGNILEVLRDDQPVPYVGRLAYRTEPTIESYIVLPPGASESVDFDLAEQYLLAGAGNYSVRWKGSGAGSYTEVAAEGSASSPALEFYYAGVSQRVIERLVPDLRGPHAGGEASKSGYTYDDCSRAREAELKIAIKGAAALAAESYSYVKATPKASRPYEERYRRWFGAYSAKRYERVKDSFKDIRDAIKDPRDFFFGFSMEIDCKNQVYYPPSDRLCQPSTAAWVNPTIREINLCPPFWLDNYPTTGTGDTSKASILLHEMSHFFRVAGTEDHCYHATLKAPGGKPPEPGCLWLALYSPVAATDSADSFTLFAERPCVRAVTPSGLTATATSSSQVNVSWSPSPGAFRYTLYRATTAGGPYTVVSTGPSTLFADAGRICGTTYFYVVSGASNSSCSSANSAPAQATPPCGTPPTANFTFTTNGLSASFTDASTDSDGTIVSRLWNFGDGATSTSTNPSRTYASPGTYPVTLTVNDNHGLTASVTKTVTVAALSPPTANFTFTTNGLFVSFTDTSTDNGTIVSRLWDFGDGDTSTSTNPSGSYAAAGTYQVTLTVTDNDGLTSSITKVVTVCDGTLYSGTLSSGGTAILPSGEGYHSNTSGNHRGTLSGPAGSDFNLILQKLDDGFVNVATSATPSNNEVISYDGSPGDYRYVVDAYSGSGNYTLCIKNPS